MASLTGGEKLQILGDRGLRVHPTGPVTDWEDRPAQDAKPIGQELGVRLSRRAFTPDEDETIRSWCEAAEQEGISGNRVFEQLEVVVSELCVGEKVIMALTSPASTSLLASLSKPLA